MMNKHDIIILKTRLYLDFIHKDIFNSMQIMVVKKGFE